MVLRGGRLARTLAGFVVAATGVYVQSRADVIGGAATYELAACAAVALTLGLIAAAPRSGAVLAGTAAAAAVAAVLIVPASASLSVVHTRAFDAERSGAMPDGWPPLINRYLRAHRGSTRFSFASVAPGKAAPLIAADPQPVLMLTSYRSRPLVSVRRLARLVRDREVRYFLIGRRCTSALTRATAACPATARWAIAHGTDVTPSIGLGHRRLLYRVDLCGRVSRSPALRARGRGRSATPSARRRSSPSASRASRARCVPVQRAGDG